MGHNLQNESIRDFSGLHQALILARRPSDDVDMNWKRIAVYIERELLRGN